VGIGTSNLDLWANTLSFSAGGTERARINSDGDLLVGTTTSVSTSSSQVGAEMRSNGIAVSAVNSNPCTIANRIGADGDITLFRKDGVTIGSIGTGASELFIGSNDAYLWTSGNNNAFLPASTVIGGASDGLLDLGSSSRYFKDLYLVKLDIAGGSSLDGNYAFLKSSSATVASLT
jgi:hypothetical protein